MSNKTIWQALAQAKANFEPVGLSGLNKHLGSQYAKLGDIHQATNSALLDAGLIITSAPVSVDESLVVEMSIVHVDSGEMITQRCPLLIAKNDMQGLGSAISYARRYLLLSVLDLDMDGLDDDGESIKTSRQPVQRNQARPPQPTNGSAPPQAEANPVDDDEAKPPMTETTRKRLHALGSEVYQDDWKTKRAELVEAITTGATKSSKDLTEAEARRLIGGMEARREKMQQPDAEQPA